MDRNIKWLEVRGRSARSILSYARTSSSFPLTELNRLNPAQKKILFCEAAEKCFDRRYVTQTLDACTTPLNFKTIFTVAPSRFVGNYRRCRKCTIQISSPVASETEIFCVSEGKPFRLLDRVFAGACHYQHSK